MGTLGTRHAVMGFVGLVALLMGSQAQAGELAANVDADTDTWLRSELDAAMPSLLQTEYGPIAWEHVYVVDGLGTWGAARRKGKHQGTDFVLDLPPQGDEGKVYVGTVIAGKVVTVKPGWGTYGNTVFVLREEEPKMLFVYAHLDSIWVSTGDTVETGDLIGTFGCSGNCKGLRGAHIKQQVHVEVYALPDSFKASDVSWGEKPMKQVRAKAVHDKGEGHGIDLLPYLAKHAPQLIDRESLRLRYEKSERAGGLDAYLGVCEAEGASAEKSSDPGSSTHEPPSTSEPAAPEEASDDELELDERDGDDWSDAGEDEPEPGDGTSDEDPRLAEHLQHDETTRLAEHDETSALGASTEFPQAEGFRPRENRQAATAVEGGAETRAQSQGPQQAAALQDTLPAQSTASQAATPSAHVEAPPTASDPDAVRKAELAARIDATQRALDGLLETSR